MSTVHQPNGRPVVVILSAPDHQHPYNLDAIQKLAEVRITDAAGLQETLKDADILLLWDFFSQALESAWAGAHRLAWVHAAAAGVDSILFPAFRNSDITLTNAHGVFDRPIAEFVLASILAHDKQLHYSKTLQHRHEWKHRDLQGTYGRNVVVVGTGGIGRETARLLTAVGLHVEGVGRTARTDPDFGTVHASTDLAQAVASADHVVLIAPLTEQTRGMVTQDVLAAMKPSAHLINVGRGALVDEPALIRALQAGRLAAASLDVVAEEPLPDDSPLWDMEQVHVSAHLSGDIHGWRDMLAAQFLQNLQQWTAGERMANVVDKASGFVPGK